MTSRIRVFFVVPVFLLVACTGWSGRSSLAEASPTTLILPSATATATATLPTPTPTAADVAALGVEATVDPAPTSQSTASPEPTPTPAYCPFLSGRTENGAFRSTAMAEDVRYLVHLPPCYDEHPDRAYPVLYLFHGWPLDERHWNDLGIDEWSDDWVSRGLIGPFLIVLPGVSQDGRYVYSSGGGGSFEGFVVDELVPLIDQTYRTVRAPAGRAVGGISRGGVWALEIAMRNTDVFAAVGGHSPALALNQPLPQYDPFLLAGTITTGLRYYLDAGDADWANAATIRLRDLLVELGSDVTYDMHTGGHVDELWSSSIPDYLTFYAAMWPGSHSALPIWSPPTPAATTP